MANKFWFWLGRVRAMSSIDYLAGTGIASISWSRSQETGEALPEKTINPLGRTQPSYLARIFKTGRSDAQILDSLAFKVDDERVLTPGNYQNILEQLRDIAAGAEADGRQAEVIARAALLLDELADNVTLLNLNRQVQTSS